MAHKIKISDEKEFAAQIASSLAAGENPITAFQSAVDSNHDGRVTFGELKAHRWKIVLWFIGFAMATLLWKFREMWGFLNDNWVAVMAAVLTFVGGWFFGWLFREELKGLEERLENITPGELIFSGAVTATNAVTSGDPGASLATAAPARIIAQTAGAVEATVEAVADVAAAAAVSPEEVA